jgi:hypothetical protein
MKRRAWIYNNAHERIDLWDVRDTGDKVLLGYIFHSPRPLSGTPWAWATPHSLHVRHVPTRVEAGEALLKYLGVPTPDSTSVDGWTMAVFHQDNNPKKEEEAKVPPPKPEVTPEQVINALIKKPELLWDVLKTLRDSPLKVAGPWEPAKDSLYAAAPESFHCKAIARRTLGDLKVAKLDTEPYEGQFHYLVFSDGTRAFHAMTYEDALRDVEVILREGGWILVP